MKKFTLPQVKNPSETPARSALEEVLRDGAKRLLQEAIEYEVLEYVQKFKEMKDEMNNRLVTRNGYLPARDEILSKVVFWPLSIPFDFPFKQPVLS